MPAIKGDVQTIIHSKILVGIITSLQASPRCTKCNRPPINGQSPIAV